MTMNAVTTKTLLAQKQSGEKIVSLTAYDATFARLLDEAGVDVILVGDSLGMVVQGQPTTLPVTMDDMVYHSRLVARGARRALIVVDMPFGSIRDQRLALKNATRLMKEGGAQMVKLEIGEHNIALVRALSDNGIPVCAHLGLLPQSVYKLGGYRVQGRDEVSAANMMRDAVAIQQAGADLLVLECVPATLARDISRELKIPVIGIGAGVDTDGQVLVLYDLLGITPGKRPRFTKDFMRGHDSVQAAVAEYVAAVRSADFPTADHSFADAAD